MILPSRISRLAATALKTGLLKPLAILAKGANRVLLAALRKSFPEERTRIHNHARRQPSNPRADGGSYDLPSNGSFSSLPITAQQGLRFHTGEAKSQAPDDETLGKTALRAEGRGT